MQSKQAEAAAWKELKNAARELTVDGCRALVPVIGAGFNTQAFKNKRLEWRELLIAVRDRTGVSVNVPEREVLWGHATLVWEAILTKLSAEEDARPSRSEAKLQNAVAEVVLDFYGPGSALARAFAELRFCDVLSYNFDLGFHTARPRFRKGRRFHPVMSHLVERSSRTRVWYPHGCALDPSSLQLGIRKYGTLLRQLEAASLRFRREQRLLRKALRLGSRHFPGTERERRARIAEKHRAHGAPASWLVAALCAPLLFIGVGLGNEEWDVWWLLNQRLRYLARSEERLPAFVFTHRCDAERLGTAASLAGLTLLPFDDYEDGWQRLGDCLGADLLGASQDPK